MIVSARKYVTVFAAAALVAVAVSACGGGGGGSPTTDGGGTMPADDGGMAIEFGDERLTAAPGTSPEASTSADTILSLGGSNRTLAPLSAPLGFESDAQGNESVVPLEDDRTAYIESTTIADAQGNYSIVYVIDDQRTEVQFGPSDFTGAEFAKMVDGVSYYSWSGLTFRGDRQNTIVPQYFWLFGWQAGVDVRGYAANGMLTQPDRLTSLGSATYEGVMVADYWRSGNLSANYFDSAGTVWGELTLEANFAGGNIEGSIDNIRIEDHGDSFSGMWLELADTNSIQLENGAIDGNRFHAAWQGQDSDTSSALDRSMRGFEGSMLGEFYGPYGEEAGGVVTGQRDSTNQIINGRFSAEKQ